MGHRLDHDGSGSVTLDGASKVSIGGSGSEITYLNLQCKTSQPFWPASCTDLPTMIGQMALDLGHLMEHQKFQLVGLDKAHSR